MYFKKIVTISAIALLAACGSGVETPRGISNINSVTLSENEVSELNAAVSRGNILVNGRRATTLNEAMIAINDIARSEREMAPNGSVPVRRYVNRNQIPTIPSYTNNQAIIRANLSQEQISVFNREMKARLTPTQEMLSFGRSELERVRNRNLIPGSAQGSVATRLGVADFSVLYNDGTVTNPARPIHGSRGDYVLRFSFTPSEVTAAPTAPRVAVNLQVGGAYVGQIQAPVGEVWRTPLTSQHWNVQRTGLLSVSGRMVILDAQTQPVEFGTTGVWRDAKLFFYQYSYNPFTGFQATHYRTVTLPKATPTIPSPTNPFPWVIGSGAVFPGSIALLSVPATENQTITTDPEVVVTDNFNGVYYTSDNLSVINLGILDSRMAGGVRAGVIQGVGPDGNYDVITPPPPGSPPEYAGVIGIYPGAHSVTSVVVRNSSGTITQNRICWSVSWSNNPDGSPNPQGMGLHCLDRDELTNQLIPPVAKTHDPAFGGFGLSHVVVVPGTQGLGDLVDALDNDRWNAPNMLYWMRAPADSVNQGCAFYSALRRINLNTGVVELVKCDRSMFGWTNETSSSPTFIGFPVSKQIPSVGQEYNNSNLNMLVALGLRPEVYFQSLMPTVIAPTVTLF